MSYRTPVSGNRMVYGGSLMRSNLEVDLAISLDAHRITWQYEAREITLPDQRRYIPDFYLPDGRNTVADADYIEVKDRKIVWRCAETLGLGSATEEGRRGLAWTPPVRLADVDLHDENWSVLRKPVLASIMGDRFLIVGANSINAAVILMHKGLASAKRTHPLTNASASFTESQTVTVTRQEVERGMLGLADQDKTRAQYAANATWATTPWVNQLGTIAHIDAEVHYNLGHMRRLLEQAQEQHGALGGAA